MATRSALRTGWLTRGLRLKMPDPRWIRSVARARKAIITSLDDRWLYSVSAWCSENQAYFQFVRSASTTSSTSRRKASCSRSVSCAPGPGT